MTTTIAIRYFVVVIAVYGGVTTVTARQAESLTSEPQRSRELTARLFGGDASWEWVPAIHNRPGPLVKSERRVLVGSWRRGSAGGDVVVSIYVVDTLKDAEQWLALHAEGAKDWAIRPYAVGDGGWRAEHPTGQIQISFRRQLYVTTVGAKDPEVVERCARQIVLYLDAI